MTPVSTHSSALESVTVTVMLQVFCMVKEEPSTPKASEPPTTQLPPGHSTHKTVSSSPPPPGESSLLYQATSSTAPTGSKTISSGPVVPDYFASIVTLIEKWQTRILEIPNVLEEDPTAPRTALGSRSHDSNDSGSPRESASVDSKHSPKMGSKKNSSRGGSRKASQEQKQLVGETIIKVAVSPGISPGKRARSG